MSGAGVWLFKELINQSHQFSIKFLSIKFSTLDMWIILFIPAIGGLIVGLMKYFLIGEERHHGVAGIMEAVALVGEIRQPVVMNLKDTDDLEPASEIFAKSNHHVLPVINSENELVGMLTIFDFDNPRKLLGILRRNDSYG